MIIKIIQDLRKQIEKMQEMFTIDLEELKNKQYTIEINSIITEAEDQMSDLVDKVVESLQQSKI